MVFRKINLFFLTLAIVFVAHLVLLFVFARDVPRSDDFDSIFGFLINFQSADFLDRLALCFSFHNEHVILPVRLSALLWHYGLGGISFIGMMVLGSLILALGVWIIHRATGVQGKNDWIHVALVLLAFNFASDQNFLWAMASLQNFGALTLGFLTIHLLYKKKNIASGLLAVMTVFSGGNGILVLVIGLLILLIERRDFRWIAFWLLISVFAITVFLSGYQPVPGHPSILASFKNPVDLVKHFFLLLGSFTTGISYKLQMLAGAMCAMALVLIGIRWKDIPRPLGYFLLFPLGTCALISMSRSGFGPEQALASRYVIYGNLVIFFVVFILGEVFPRVARPLRVAILVGSVTSYFVSFTYFPEMKDYAKRMEFASAVYFDNEIQETAFFYPPGQTFARELLERFSNTFSFSLTKYSYPEFHSASSASLSEFRVYYREDSTLSVEGMFVLDSIPSDKVFLELGYQDSVSEITVPMKKSFVEEAEYTHGYRQTLVRYTAKLDGIGLCEDSQLFITGNEAIASNQWSGVINLDKQWNELKKSCQ